MTAHDVHHAGDVRTIVTRSPDGVHDQLVEIHGLAGRLEVPSSVMANDTLSLLAPGGETIEQGLLRPFASPHGGGFLPLAERLTCSHVRGIASRVQRIAERTGAPPLAVDPATLTPARISTHGWLPELGAARLGCVERLGIEPAWLVAQMQLSLYFAGALDAVELELTSERPLAIAGRILRRDRIRICGDRQRLTVVTPAGQLVLALTRIEPPGMRPVWAREVSDVIDVGSSAIAVRASNDWMLHWDTAAARGEACDDPARHLACVERAVSVLEAYVPSYYRWVAALMREVVPLRREAATPPRSQSFLIWPGQIHVSRASVAAMVGMLVHACTHQYFHLACWTGSLIKPGAPSPMERILLGYHAAANTLLAYRGLASSVGRCPDLDARELADHTARCAAQAASLGDGLEAHLAYLAPLGRDLYEPLRDCVAATR